MRCLTSIFLGCSASLYKFWSWHTGPRIKWGPEAVEMGPQWAKPKWKGNTKILLLYNSCPSCLFDCFYGLIISEKCCLKATASVTPQHWQPNSGLLMTNDISGVNLEEAVPCIALSKNDSYVMSAAGGKVSLFNMMTFKVKSIFFVLEIL